MHFSFGHFAPCQILPIGYRGRCLCLPINVHQLLVLFSILVTFPTLAAGEEEQVIVYSPGPISPVQLRQLSIQLELGTRETVRPPARLDPLLLDALRQLPPLETQLRCANALRTLQPNQSQRLATSARSLPSASDFLPSTLTELETALTNLDEELALELARTVQLLLGCLERPLDSPLLERSFLLLGMAHLYAGDEQHQGAFRDLASLRAKPKPPPTWPQIVQQAYSDAYKDVTRTRSYPFSPAELGIVGQVWIDGKPVLGQVLLRPGRHLLQVILPSIFQREQAQTAQSLLFTLLVGGGGQNIDPPLPEALRSEEEAVHGLLMGLNAGTLPTGSERVIQHWLTEKNQPELYFFTSSEQGTLLLQRYTKAEGLLPVSFQKARPLLVKGASPREVMPEGKGASGNQGAPDRSHLAHPARSLQLGARVALYQSGEVTCVEGCGSASGGAAGGFSFAPSAQPELELLVLGRRGPLLGGLGVLGRAQSLQTDQDDMNKVYYTGILSLLGGPSIGKPEALELLALLELSFGASPLFTLTPTGDIAGPQLYTGVSQLLAGGRLLLRATGALQGGRLRLGGGLGLGAAFPLKTMLPDGVQLEAEAGSRVPWGAVLSPSGTLILEF